MARVTLRERFFPLQEPDHVDRFLDRALVDHLQGWHQRQDLRCVDGDADGDGPRRRRGRLRPAARGSSASDHVNALTEVPHRSPQLLPSSAAACFHLDEFAIVPDQLVRCSSRTFQPSSDRRSATKPWSRSDSYRRLLSEFVAGTLPEERFQWGYLERLEKEALWRDDETFGLLNSLFGNEWGRDVRAARLIAVEFQGQLAGRLEPLRARAVRMLERLTDRGGHE
jgi:hypothetical protein